MRFRKKPFRRTFRKRVVPDVLPVQLCNFPIAIAPATDQDLDWPGLCAALEPSGGFPVVTTATVLLDGGQLVQLGSQLNGISKGFKFRSLTCQYDYVAFGHPGLDSLATLFHGVVKVKMGNDTTGARVPMGFPNLMSQYDNEVGEVLWRRQERFYIPKTTIGTTNAMTSLQAGIVQNDGSSYDYKPFQHSTTMHVTSRRNIKEDEALLWIQQGYIISLQTGTVLLPGGLPAMYASLYGRMIVSNWQS